MKYFVIAALSTFLRINSVNCQIAFIDCSCDEMSVPDFEPKLTGEQIQDMELTKDSQFYYDWDDADITMLSGDVIHNKRLRYNGYINEMIWQTPLDYKLVKLDKTNIKEVYFKNLQSLFKKLNIKGQYDSVSIFAEVLFEKKIRLYAYRKISKGTDELTTQSGTTFLRSVTVNKSEYFIKVPEIPMFFSFSKLNYRNLLKSFPQNRKEIRKLLRQNHIRVNSEKNLDNALNLIVSKFY